MTTPRPTSPSGGPREPSSQDTPQTAWEKGDIAGFAPDPAAAVWPAFMAAGIGSVVVGVILLVWPKETLTIVAVLIGAGLMVAGILRLMDGFTSHDASGPRRVASVVIGLLAIILGLYCIRHYHFTITALAIITGLFWVIHGIADVATGLFAGPFTGRAFIVLTGVLSLCAGFIVLFWPTISLTVIVAVIGIWLIIYGLIAAFLGFRLRRSGAGQSEPEHLSAA